MQKFSLQELHYSNVAIRKRLQDYLQFFSMFSKYSFVGESHFDVQVVQLVNKDGVLLKYLINFMLIISATLYYYKTIIL